MAETGLKRHRAYELLAGVTAVCEVVITPSAGKVEAYLRLPTPELMQWGSDRVADGAVAMQLAKK